MNFQQRKSMIVAAIAALALALPMNAAVAGSQQIQIAQSVFIESGTYVGRSRSERFVVSVVFGEGNIRLTRADNGNTTLFSPIRSNNYRNDDGAVIKVRNQSSFVFQSANGSTTISFRKQ